MAIGFADVLNRAAVNSNGSAPEFPKPQHTVYKLLSDLDNLSILADILPTNSPTKMNIIAERGRGNKGNNEPDAKVFVTFVNRSAGIKILYSMLESGCH